MGDIVNLNRARKVKVRLEAQAKAAANRASHGRTQALKALAKARADKAARDFAAHKLDR
jgi:hypothetical protein